MDRDSIPPSVALSKGKALCLNVESLLPSYEDKHKPTLTPALF